MLHTNVISSRLLLCTHTTPGSFQTPTSLRMQCSTKCAQTRHWRHFNLNSDLPVQLFFFHFFYSPSPSSLMNRYTFVRGNVALTIPSIAVSERGEHRRRGEQEKWGGKNTLGKNEKKNETKTPARPSNTAPHQNLPTTGRVLSFRFRKLPRIWFIDKFGRRNSVKNIFQARNETH